MRPAESASEDDDHAAKRPRRPLSVTINYTRQRAGFERCGAVAGANGLALLPCTFREQHGSIPYDLDPSQLGSELVPVECEVRNARLLDPAPSLATHGFQLWATALPLTPLAPDDANEPGAPLDRHYREVEAAVADAVGASGAAAYCHVRRSATQAVQKGSAGGPFARYAHTDMAADSWSDVLPSLVASGEWAERGPPHIPPAFADRCARARRYAIITAWRYLGPAEACRSSHLAVLDPSTVAAADFLPFDIAAFGNVGHNYRLAAPAAGADDGARRHEWWYVPELKRSGELLLLIAFDSAHPDAVRCAAGDQRPFSGLPLTTVFHSAFADPSASADEPERESIDTRVLVVWD